MKKIYLASPFFNEEEIKRMLEVRDVLRQKGLEVFSPYEHQHKELEFGSKKWRDTVFNSDLNSIDTCDLVVAVVSQGNYSDSGTCWELGYAYAKEIPTIVVNLEGKAVNLMIADSLTTYIDSIEKLKNYDFTKLKPIRYEEYVW